MYFAGLLVLFLVQSLGAPVQPEQEDIDEDHELIGGFFQGDMEVDWTRNRNGLIAESRRWPNGIVPYKIDGVFDADHTLYIRRAMRSIEKVSCIRFIPALDDAEAYLLFIGKRSGCHSKVGYQGNIQTLNLQVDRLKRGCFKSGSIKHEILHTLGFHHQQSATDRDDYVLIVKENITEGRANSFIKYDDKTLTDFNIEYDYGSIMHYSSTAFSKNGAKTIIPLKGDNIIIGQRRAMSASDIKKLNLMYKCPVPMK